MTTAASRRMLYFISVGSVAALVHLAVVFVLVNLGLQKPLIANLIGFLVAFNISYLGHKYLTFAQKANPKKLQLPYFFIVAASAGIFNEWLYFLFLHFTQLNYLVSLFFVLGVVSLYTFVLSRYWAYR